MTTKVLITGANGMLGSDLVKELDRDYQVYGMTRTHDARPRFSSCDIANRIATINAIERIHPHIVIHSAAMVSTEACEQNRLVAMQVNFEGTKNVVDGCRRVKGIMVYISTDFVFSGTQKEPYRETSIPNPVNVYGETKLLGEFYVKSQSTDHLIIRTSWTFGKNGNNFMSKLLAKADSNADLEVVRDQIGSPTYTKDLAKAIHHMLDAVTVRNQKTVLNSIYHITNSGAASRYDIACELLKLAERQQVKIIPVDSDDLNLLAKRPHNSVLDHTKFEKTFQYKLRPWREALQDYLRDIKT